MADDSKQSLVGQAPKDRVASIIRTWIGRAALKLLTVAVHTGMTEDVFYHRYLDVTRPVHTNPNDTLAVIKTFNRVMPSKSRFTASEVIEFCNYTQLPLVHYDELRRLIGTKTWAEEWDAAMAQYVRIRQAAEARQREEENALLLQQVLQLQQKMREEQKRFNQYLQEQYGDQQELVRLTHELEKRGVPSEALLRLRATTHLVHRIPPRPGVYIEREVFEKVLEALKPQSRTYLVTIGGAGGLGKTTLAIELAHHCWEQGRFEQIIWTTAQPRRFSSSAYNSTPFIEYEGMLDEILRAFRFPDARDFSLDQKQNLVYQYLADGTTLLIVDNLESVRNFTAFISFFEHLPPGTKAITTSRVKHPDIEERWIEMPPMSRSEAIDLLVQTCQIREMDISLEQMEALYTHLGGNPLALMWSLGQLRETKEQLDQFFQQLKRLHALEGADGDEQRLLDFCFREAYESRSPEAKSILLALGVFPISLTIAEVQTVLDYDMRTCKHYLEELGSHSLITYPQDGQVTVQPLARRYLTRELMRNQGERFKREWRQRYADQYTKQHSSQRLICVFTPDYLPRFLPEGATPIDFAYSIHTELGHCYTGARVDEQPVPDEYALRGGEIVEIIPGQSASPNPSWKVKTPRALQSIRAFFAKPREAEKAIRAANALCLRGKLGEAVIQYERAIMLNPHNTWARNRLGHCLRLLGEETRAMQQFRTVLSHNPPNTNTYALLGKACLLYQKRDIEGAHKLYKQAWKLRPDYINALFGLARCCCKLKRYEEANNYLTQALQQPVVDRQKAALYLFQAIALFGQGRTGDAIKFLEISLKTYDKSLRQRMDSGLALLESISSGLHALAYYAIGLACASSAHYKDYLKLMLDQGSYPGLMAEILTDLEIITSDIVSLMEQSTAGDVAKYLKDIRHLLRSVSSGSNPDP